jgi:glycosyltransferase involved in cell wall biosynthesis
VIEVCFRCPDAARPSGGVRLIFRHARILCESGLRARVCAGRADGLRRWLEEGRDLLVPDVPEAAILVVPETDRAGLELPGRKVVLAQSTAFLDSAPPDENWRARGVEAAVAVSRPVAEAIRSRFGIDAQVVHPSVDTELFRPEPKERRIAFMPRRNQAGIERILARSRPEGFEPAPIDGLSPAQVACELGRAAIFLAASPREGFGLPALEAMASGCLVAGFAGGGGLDFMEDRVDCLLARDGDEEGAAERVAEARRLALDARGTALAAKARETARRFAPARERRALKAFWESL